VYVLGSSANAWQPLNKQRYLSFMDLSTEEGGLPEYYNNRDEYRRSHRYQACERQMMHIAEQGKREREKDSEEQDNNHSRSKKVPNKTVNMYPLRLE